jgi:pyridoxine 5-phosphate synthase
MNDAGIEVSLFIAPEPDQVVASAKIGAQFIELHTGAFAEHYQDADCRRDEVGRLVAAARQAHDLGLKVNAGHGINYVNVRDLYEVPHLVELNIGHSIISRAVFAGLSQSVREMLEAMKGYRG